jgi:glycosyltransferase involved in cell wall biosynthesis
MKKLKILDWYCHQGHQYEFFKTGHDFYLVGIDGGKPNWNGMHRPLNSNVNLIYEKEISKINFDAVIIRSPILPIKYTNVIRRGAKPIAVVQTTNAFPFPRECRHVVWNCLSVLNSNRHRYPKMNHYHIVHGFDPEEFKKIDLEKNNRILTVANVFKKRSQIMGYNLWKGISDELGLIDLVGHGNTDINRNDNVAESLEALVRIYNKYNVYFNPTQSSAMPRSRAEAVMCGMPLVSTNNFDIDLYFKNGKTAILSNNKDELLTGLKMLINNENMQKDYSLSSRQIAIEKFHIKDYLLKWNQIFGMI